MVSWRGSPLPVLASSRVLGDTERPPIVRLLMVRQLLTKLLETVAASAVISREPTGRTSVSVLRKLAMEGRPADQFDAISHLPLPVFQLFVTTAARDEVGKRVADATRNGSTTENSLMDI